MVNCKSVVSLILLQLLFLSLCSCARKETAPVAPTNMMNAAERQQIVDSLNAETIPPGVKLLSMTRFSVEEERPKRVRTAISGSSEGVLRIQILPTTSLMVLQTITIDAERRVQIIGGNDEQQDELLLSPNRIRTLFGEIIEPQDFYALLFGKVPRSSPFAEFYRGEGTLVETADGAVFSAEKLQLTLIDGVLTELALRDSFQEKEVLLARFSEYQERKGIFVPQKVVLTFPKRQIVLDMGHRKFDWFDRMS